MGDNKSSMAELPQSEGFWLRIYVDADRLAVFEKARENHKQEGPDLLTIANPIISIPYTDGQNITGELKNIRDKITEFNLSFKTFFAPEPEVGRLRCLIAGVLTEFFLDNIVPEDWLDLANNLTKRNATLGLGINSLNFILPLLQVEITSHSELVQIVPSSYKVEYFKTPGRLFDTPRHIVGQDKDTLLPEISRWYQQTAFNRTVCMAAAALTKKDTRDTILDWQSATVEEVADLVFCRSEEGTPAHGEHRERILKAFEALRAIPIPIVKIDWKQIGTNRNPRWIKEYKLRVASMLQSYGPVFVDKKTGKEVVTGDPARKKDLVKAKPDRRKTIRKLIEMNPVEGIMKDFPVENYTLTRFEWRWNTDIAEDFICPEVALAEDNRPRLKQVKGRHIEGSRFIMLNIQYFSVLKHLRADGSTYAPRLLDKIVSEKRHIINREKDAVWIEIEAERIIKWLDLWAEYQSRPKHVLEDHIAPAVMALIREKVLLLESWLVPQKDKNEDHWKDPYYRWKVAELWTTVALVAPEKVQDIEGELVQKAEAEEAAQSHPELDALPKPKAEQTVLPGIMEVAQSIPSGADIRAAREAAKITLRRFAEIIAGPDFSTWCRYETGKPIRIESIKTEVWNQVWNFIAQHGGKGPENEGNRS